MARRKLIPVNGWTPTQKRIIDLLSDLQAHTRDEMARCLSLPDDEDALANLRNHLSQMREKLRPKGIDIVCVNIRRRTCYRLYRLIAQE